MVFERNFYRLINDRMHREDNFFGNETLLNIMKKAYDEYFDENTEETDLNNRKDLVDHISVIMHGIDMTGLYDSYGEDSDVIDYELYLLYLGIPTKDTWELLSKKAWNIIL